MAKRAIDAPRENQITLEKAAEFFERLPSLFKDGPQSTALQIFTVVGNRR